MDFREDVIRRKFPKDIIQIRVPATYLRLDYFNYYKISIAVWEVLLLSISEVPVKNNGFENIPF